METFFNILTGIMIMSYNYARVSGESPIAGKYIGYWKLDGSDPDVRYNNVNFTEGRCPGSKGMVFGEEKSHATVPNVSIGDCDYTIAFWIRLYQSNHAAAIMGSSRSGGFLRLLVYFFDVFICDEAPTPITLGNKCEVGSPSVDMFSWTHIAVTCEQDNGFKMFFNGELASIRKLVIELKEVAAISRPPRETFLVDHFVTSRNPPVSRLLIMDLHILGFALPPDEIYNLNRDFVFFTNQAKQVKGRTVIVRLDRGSCSAFVVMYTVYYREVRPGNNNGTWKVVNVSKFAGHYNLELKCFKEYEVSVNGWGARTLTPWRVKTGQGKLSPPVGDNKTMEISSCVLNYMWSPPKDTGCPLTMYIIYQREIQSDGNEANWLQISITQLEKTSYVIQLKCDMEYEIAMSVKDEQRESVMSNFWRVKTKSPGTDIPYSNFLLDGKTAGVIVGCLALVAMILVGIGCHRKKTRKRKLNALLAKRLKADMIPLQQREIPPERITFMEELGRGAFGKVQRGALKELPTVEIFDKPRDQRVEIKEAKVVAIKTLLATATEEGKERFLQEIDLMKQIGRHRNVLSMLGYWVKSEPIMLILEYVPHGDLLEWLRSKRQKIKFKNIIDGEIFKDLTQATSEDEIGSTKTPPGSTENSMPNSFITVKDEALIRKTLVFKALDKEKDDEKKEEEFQQCCHEVMEVIVSTKGEPGTAREEAALLASYNEGTDGNLGLTHEADTKAEKGKCKEERKKGKEVKEENDCKYPNIHSESQCSPLLVAGPSGIDKDPDHTCDVFGSDSRMTPDGKEQKEININTTQDDVHPVDVEQSDGFRSNDLLSFAWQIANGMDYLASKGFVHRDLAARNILLGEDRVVKIADFGLLRDTQGNVYEMKHTKKLPIKWTAPEALHNGIYTTKSDVWSFGVLLWELTTMGSIPYPGISHKEMYRLLKTGYRMAKPKSCSDELYTMMSNCWKEVPDERPTFEQLIVQLEQMMTRDTPYFDFEKLDETEPQ